MPKISRITAREILDSRATPTIEVSLLTDMGVFGTASIPSGASTGGSEDVELRDGDPSRYNGKGVLKAISNVQNILAPKLLGLDISEQEKIDHLMIELDGTSNESKLGANAILAISIAALKAAAASSKLPFSSILVLAIGLALISLFLVRSSISSTAASTEPAT